MKKTVNYLSALCVLLAILCLSTCGENEQVIAILSAPSQLAYLGVIVYAGEFQIPGGASIEPAFRADVFEYTVYVDKDTTHISVDAGIDDEGTVTIYSENDQVSGDADTKFDLLGDEAALTVTVQAQYMQRAEYEITVIRGEPAPTAKDVEISVEPGVAAFFIGSGVVPTLRVTAVPPGAGVALNYQWYVNDENNTRTGSPITNANGDSYRMQAIETMVERDVYYYVEITSVLDGKTGTTQSAPCRVTFVNKGALHEKSFSQNYMADVPPAEIDGSAYSSWNITVYQYNGNSTPDWSTPGFRIGRYLVTWELWETVFKHAERGNYIFMHEGNQGYAVLPEVSTGVIIDTVKFPQPIGNKLHPVTNITWTDAVVWCNAYSEMDGLQPVYRDSGGEPLRNSRYDVGELYDEENIDYNGYRLPTIEEWVYAGRGANPSGSHWNDRLPGTNSTDIPELAQYIWHYSATEATGLWQTGEVGSRLPNQLWNGSRYADGLYDMAGMNAQWVDYHFGLKTFNNKFIGHYSGASYDVTHYDSGFSAFRIAQTRK